MATMVRAQLALDEKFVEDHALEAALEERQRRKDSLSAVRAEFNTAAKLAEAEVEKQELPEGVAIRVGRFRIARTRVAARHISFDTEESTRVRISLIGDED